jgi:flagellar hook-associated protein 3 FlgL
MRVATGNVFERTLESLQRRQQDLLEAQGRLASGKRVQRPSDDPTATARAERALAQVQRAEASQRGLEASRNAIVQSESALGDAADLLQQARELVVQAGNTAYGDAQRATIAQALRGIRSQLVGIANRGDGAGGFLFAGQGTATPPFVDGPSGVEFRGIAGALQAASGEPLPLTVDGEATWMRAASGNGVFETRALASNGNGAWIDAGRVVDPAALSGDVIEIAFSTGTAGTTYAVLRNGAATAVTAAAYADGEAIVVDGMAVSVNGRPAAGDRFELIPATRDESPFAALDRIATELARANRSGAQVAQSVSHGLRDLDQTMGLLTSVRSGLGETLSRTDAVEDRLAESNLQAQAERSTAEDVDLAVAASEFQARQTSYDAALKTYSMVQRMSLFDYIK